MLRKAVRLVADVLQQPQRIGVAREAERFVGHDGMPLTGWLYRPPGAALPGATLLSLHGGPESQ